MISIWESNPSISHERRVFNVSKSPVTCQVNRAWTRFSLWMHWTPSRFCFSSQLASAKWDSSIIFEDDNPIYHCALEHRGQCGKCMEYFICGPPTSSTGNSLTWVSNLNLYVYDKCNRFTLAETKSTPSSSFALTVSVERGFSNGKFWRLDR